MGRFGNLRERTIDDEYVTGWVPPGYDNLGPGNEVRIGPAGRSGGDVRARTHDIGYGEEEAAGVNPYVNWVDADETFMEELEVEGPSTAIAKGLFSAKKAAKNLGLIGNMSGKGKRKAKAPVRENPWDEGENYRKAREEKRKRREDNDATRDEAWEMARTGRDRAYETIERYRATGEWQPDENVYNAQQNRALWVEARNRDLERGIDWSQFEAGDAMEGWRQANGQVAEESKQEDEPMEDIDLSVANLPGNAEAMAERAGGDDVEMADASARSAGGPSNQLSKETPISVYPSLSYGLQETHTTILPWTGWCSAQCAGTGGPAEIRIRMNTPYDFWQTSITQWTTNPLNTSNTIYNKQIHSDDTIQTAFGFPETMSDGGTNERPYWRDYWGQLYEYYTVLGCEYKITMVNPIAAQGATAIVGKTFDSYSDTQGSTGNVTPATNLSEAMSLKGFQFKVIEASVASNNGRNTETIYGRYKPGDARRNVSNDGDVQTWHKTYFNGVSPISAGVPKLNELLVLQFWRAPLAHATAAVNIQVELKWIVQFKDLRSMARYPVTTGSGATINQIISTTRTDAGNPIARWTV